jgi:hypothetical protein
VCLLIRCIGPGTVSVVLHRHRSTLLQSAMTAKPDSEFIHQARFAPDRILASHQFHAPYYSPTDVIQDTALFLPRRKIRCGMEIRLSLLTPGRSARWPPSWASATPSQAKAVGKLVRGKLLRRAGGGAEGRLRTVSPGEACVRHSSPEALPSQGCQVQECLFEQRRSKNKVRTHAN